MNLNQDGINPRHVRILQYGIPLLLIFLSLAIIFTVNPIFRPIPRRDSGGFMYIGQQLLNGRLLYTDLFDNKPPLIFWVNTLGLLISNGSTWGVWVLEAISLSVTVLLAYFLFIKNNSIWPMLFAIVAFLANLLLLLDGGNLTEEYALPFQFLILVCVFPKDINKHLTWQAFLAGAAWGLTFYFKQSIFGIGLAAGIFLFIRGVIERHNRRYWEVMLYFAGFLIVVGGVPTYFFVQGNFWNFWDATFISNFAYISINETSRISLIIKTIIELLTRNIFLAATLVLWLVMSLFFFWAILIFLSNSRYCYSWQILKRRKEIFFGLGIAILIVGLTKDYFLERPIHFSLIHLLLVILGAAFIFFGFLERSSNIETWFKSRLFPNLSPRIVSLFIVAWLAFLLDIVSISLSGKFFTHYFITILPSASILVAIFISVLLKLPKTTLSKHIIWVCIILTFIQVAWQPLTRLPLLYRISDDEQRQTVINYVKTFTQPNDHVLMWGGEPVINFLTGRTRPNRFVYMSQLFLSGYANEKQAQEMLNDLMSSPPKLIIYSRVCSIPFIDYKTTACVPVSQSWEKVFQFIKDNYEPVVDLGPEKWNVYKHNN